MARRKKRSNPKTSPAPAPEEPARAEAPAADAEPAAAPACYPRWLGTLLAVLLTGSAHALSGAPRQAALWFAAIQGAGLASLWFFALPGQLPLWIALAGFLVSVGLWLAMLKSSYRPVRRLRARGWLLFALLTVAAQFPFSLVFWPGLQAFSTPTSSMAPTIEAGDSFIVSSLLTWFQDLERWDIVVFRQQPPARPGGAQPEEAVYVRRIAGLPGERIRILPQGLEVDGRLVLLPPALLRAGHPGYKPLGLLDGPSKTMVLKADEYLLLGDRTENSLDGRISGPTPRSAIFGRATRIFAPLGKLTTSLDGR